MTSEPFGEVSSEAFFSRYWQREPLLVRGGVDPEPLQPVDRRWLFQASNNPLLHSRLVEGPDERGGYSVTYGPNLALPESGLPWTLLVRDVDKVLPQADALLDRFAGVGRWRLEDIMVSFAATGGSVGPHLDHYDVFLVQASGRRRWQVDPRPQPHAPFQPDQELQILEQFDPSEEWILQPGDWLYLPPGVPHHGVALEPCTTWSVGLRAPSAAELWADFAQWQIERCSEALRLADPYRNPRQCGRLLAQDLAQVRDMLGGLQQLDDGELASWLGCFLTRGGADWEAPAQGSDKAGQRPAGGSLQRAPGALLAWYADREKGWLFANGEPHAVDPECAALLAGQRTLSAADRERLVRHGHRELLRDLVAQGVFQAA